MKALIGKAIAIALLLGILFLLHDAFQYRDAAKTIGTITQVGQKACFYSGETLRFGCNRIAARMSYKDGELDREVDIEYGISGGRHRSYERYHRRLPTAAVGVQVPVVYVPGRPWLTQLAVNHIRGWETVWIGVFLALIAWLAWLGDKHPLMAWFNSRRDHKKDDHEWRDIQPIDRSKK